MKALDKLVWVQVWLDVAFYDSVSFLGRLEVNKTIIMIFSIFVDQLIDLNSLEEIFKQPLLQYILLKRMTLMFINAPNSISKPLSVAKIPTYWIFSQRSKFVGIHKLKAIVTPSQNLGAYKSIV